MAVFWHTYTCFNFFNGTNFKGSYRKKINNKKNQDWRKLRKCAIFRKPSF